MYTSGFHCCFSRKNKMLRPFSVPGPILALALACGMLWLTESTGATLASHIVSGEWTAADGLPVDTVNSLTLGPEGRLWVGTHDGLARFDGFTFTHFNVESDPALPSNRVSRVGKAGGQVIVRFENGAFGSFDDAGYHPIGQVTRENLHVDEGGLWYVDEERLMRWEPGTGTRKAIAFAGLELIHPDPTGQRLILATDGPGVFEFQPAENRTRIVTDQLASPAIALATSLHGQLGILTRDSLHVLDLHATDRVETITFARPQWDHRSLAWTPEGWLATMDGPPPFGRLMRISDQSVEPIESAPHDFHHFVMSRTDDQKRLWVNQGTRLYRDGELIHSGKSPINDFQVDRYGQIWLATEHYGLKRLTEPVMQTACRSGDCIEDPNTYLVAEHGDGLLIGNQSALYHHEPEKNSWTRLIWLYPLSALVDGDEILLGGNGLCRLQPDGTCAGRPSPPYHEVRMLLRDHTSAIWKGAGHGLFRRAPNGQWSDQPLTTAFVRTAVALDDERLLLGTADSGLLMALISSPEHPIEALATTENGLASNAVRSLHVLPDQRVLVGLEDRGMCLLDPDRDVERCISTAEGLPHHSVHRMIEDDYRRLWVNTNNGIYFVGLDHLLEFFEGRVTELTASKFDTRDGMPGNEGNGGIHQAGTRTADGRIWFPNQHGVVVIDPSRVTSAHHELAAVITPVDHIPGTSLSLSPERRLLRTRLSATALRGKETVQFRYRLGEQAAWNFIGDQTELAFESLAPGSYRLQVQARYLDGDWPNQTAFLAFEVPPRLAERSSFWFMLGLAGLLMLGGLYWRERTQVFRLEHQVTEHTADLRNALVTVKAQADDIRRTADQRHQMFLAISHELRTPLTLILGPLQKQSRKPSLSELSRMRHGAEQMQTMVEQILDLEQIDYARIEPTEPTHLPTLLERVTENLTEVAEAQGSKIETQWHNGCNPSWIMADSVQLDRALSIVIDNAIKHSQQGGQILISMGVAPGAAHAKIRIEDNGPGIAPDFRESIFEPFVRGDTHQPGHGLGLALCRRILEQHNGTITVGDSSLGGACFSMELTLVESQDKACPVAEEGSELVLVVDDNPGIRAHISEVLTGRYRVIEAADGHEAERMAKIKQPDAMLVDAAMPRVNGFELVKRLREDELTAHIPVIFCTAHADRDHEIRAFDTGADQFLKKPFSAEQLLSRLHQALTRRRTDSNTQLTSSRNSLAAVSASSTLVSRVEQALINHLDDPDLDVGRLAALVGTSRASLYRDLKVHCNATPAEFVRDFRLRRAAELLRQSDMNISQIAIAVGFRRLSAFTRAFRTRYNCTPSNYREHAANDAIMK